MKRKTGDNNLIKFLRNYRTTPHSTTGTSPAELLFGRRLNNKLPDVHRYDTSQKMKMKEYADRRRSTKQTSLQCGDLVLLKKNEKILNKSETPYEENPFTVVNVEHSMITAKQGKRIVIRNISLFKLFKPAQTQILPVILVIPKPHTR